MDANKFAELVEAMYARDAANFNFDDMVNRAVSRASASCSVPGYMDLLGDLLKSVGPEIFESGYFAGATAGLEIAKELRR